MLYVLERRETGTYSFSSEKYSVVPLSGKSVLDSIPTSKLMKEFNKLTADTMSDSAIENVEELISVFYRADYIRFAAGSIDSKRLPVQEFSAELQEGEAKKLLNQIRKIINCFEGEVENA